MIVKSTTRRRRKYNAANGWERWRSVLLKPHTCPAPIAHDYQNKERANNTPRARWLDMEPMQAPNRRRTMSEEDAKDDDWTDPKSLVTRVPNSTRGNGAGVLDAGVSASMIKNRTRRVNRGKSDRLASEAARTCQSSKEQAGTTADGSNDARSQDAEQCEEKRRKALALPDLRGNHLERDLDDVNKSRLPTPVCDGDNAVCWQREDFQHGDSTRPCGQRWVGAFRRTYVFRRARRDACRMQLWNQRETASRRHPMTWVRLGRTNFELNDSRCMEMTHWTAIPAEEVLVAARNSEWHSWKGGVAVRITVKHQMTLSAQEECWKKGLIVDTARDNSSEGKHKSSIQRTCAQTRCVARCKPEMVTTAIDPEKSVNDDHHRNPAKRGWSPRWWPRRRDPASKLWDQWRWRTTKDTSTWNIFRGLMSARGAETTSWCVQTNCPTHSVHVAELMIRREQTVEQEGDAWSWWRKWPRSCSVKRGMKRSRTHRKAFDLRLQEQWVTSGACSQKARLDQRSRETRGDLRSTITPRTWWTQVHFWQSAWWKKRLTHIWEVRAARMSRRRRQVDRELPCGSKSHSGWQCPCE